LRTGPDNNETVPGHSVWNVTLRHRFAFRMRPELAIDVFNVFDEAYAIRIGNGFVGSAYGALREVDLRLTVPFGPRAAVMSRSPYESY
jgi:outer membrane receptor for ferric coprogen and ferric-rhodotorulic acid